MGLYSFKFLLVQNRLATWANCRKDKVLIFVTSKKYIFGSQVEVSDWLFLLETSVGSVRLVVIFL